ncbi:gp53-like domain-containing protein [Photorhabdus akhurstii]|uniref:gp53-like domain-containing protein n=1 Tax=Photorhabdus akhurstii TaxID=171438 RepID=UPI001C2E0637|nr:tail fiber protein [Photorhabdus akhurstii]
MSQKNDFKAFSISNNANVVSQEGYEESRSLSTGFPPENITTHLLNKVLRQSSTIASVVANFIATQSGDNVLDDGNIAKLSAQLNRALEQKITTTAPDASLTQKGVVQLTDVIGNSDSLAVTQKLAQEIINSLRENINSRVLNTRKVNGKALSSDINLNAGDVGSYDKSESDSRYGNKNTSLKAVNGWWKCGNTGMIFQWGISDVTTHDNPDRHVNFPIPFPERVIVVGEHDNEGSVNKAVWQINNIQLSGFTASNLGMLSRGVKEFGPIPQSRCVWFAWGF